MRPARASKSKIGGEPRAAADARAVAALAYLLDEQPADSSMWAAVHEQAEDVASALRTVLLVTEDPAVRKAAEDVTRALRRMRDRLAYTEVQRAAPPAPGATEAPIRRTGGGLCERAINLAIEARFMIVVIDVQRRGA